MVALFQFHEGNGAAPGTLGSVGNINMGNSDTKELDPATFPITAGNNSFELYFVGSWSGAFTKVDNVQFWQSAGSLGTGEVIKWTGSITIFGQPVVTLSGSAVGSVPTADPGTANITLGSILAGSLVAIGRSDWIVLQYQTESSASPGPTNQKTFTLQWDEQ